VNAPSRIGQYAGRVNLGEESLLIALRAYLDSSGTMAAGKFITLAALVAKDDMWKEFETAWEKILGEHSPKAQYIHMREILRMEELGSKGGFDPALGWNIQNAFALVVKCVQYMSFLDKKRFHMFYCSVDLQAWRKLRAETFQMPEPVALCNDYCSKAILGWYFNYYPDLVDPYRDTVSYFFDRNEDFKQPFEDEWNAEKNLAEQSGEWSIWQRIDDIAAVEMKKTPGIQAADIIAWTANRETFATEGYTARYLPQIIRQVIPHSYIVWNEEKMREQFKPLLYI
jgi:hypothetical protein